MATRVPAELWINVAISLRDAVPCPHGHSIGVDGSRCWEEECAYAVAARPVALIKTCHFLHDIICPLLYEQLFLDGIFPQRSGALVTTLNQRKDLHRAVRTLHIIESHKLSLLAQEINLLLPHLTRLRSIFILRSVITPATAQLFLNASDLRRLDISPSEWDEEVPQNWSTGGFGRQLQELTLDDNAGYGGGYLLSFDWWTQLLVPGLLKISVSHSFVGGVLLALESGTLSLSKIRSLTVTGYKEGNADRLSRFLQCFPDLEDLQVDERNSKIVYNFPIHILPRLRVLMGSSRLASALPRLLSLEIANVACNITCRAEDLKITAPNLRSLVLTGVFWDDHTLRIIAEQCPQIRHLEIELAFSHSVLEPDVGSMFEDIGQLARLQAMRVEWTSYFLGEHDIRIMMEVERELLIGIKANSCLDLARASLHTRQLWIYGLQSGWTSESECHSSKDFLEA